MEALSLSPSIPIALNSAVKVSNYSKNQNNKSVVYCQGGNNHARKFSGISSVFTETSSLISSDHAATTFREAGSLVLSPDGKDVEMNDDGIGIVKFLQGKSFLITGATGFLGKIIIEKILRTAPDVHSIFVLIKAKNKEAAIRRLKNEIINTELFKRLKQTHGKSYQAFMLSKLVPVVGNVCESNLGVDEEDADLITKQVDVIINSAANTTFNERYDTALDINTGGPMRLMSFARKCQKLELFLQISTGKSAYVNGQRQGRIMEKPFSLGESIAGDQIHHKLNVEDELKLVWESKQALGDDATLLQKMKELGIQRANTFGWQDTYVFTKAMGEMVVNNLRGNIPVVVIRPSVIESTYKEPFPGWMEGSRMMDPVILHYGKGQLTGFLVDPNGVLDVVPADMVVNATLAAMVKHGKSGKAETSIYQIASSVVNPLVFRDLAKLLFEHFNSLPFIDSTGVPVRVPQMKLFSSMDDFSSHLWRHAINRTGLGALSNLDGKLSQKLQLICRKSVEQAQNLANIYEPYTFYGGRFDNSNTKRLMGFMSKEERQQFGFDVENIDWKDYITNVHIPGLRRHVMKGRGLSS
ncbi:fatty acyl-CoA reductase 2-like [Dorcoceras hygrometricum]|uniref:Fatty acyl-CoA reductase n=1 Tax=Dorcoceras hygrometricum TaxID=472368 RepID=A0A2Z7BTM8_9LAMI|nr:fatty acyl-CoA reductase 2-like [Dorcoceras hygrometricum]